MDIIKEYDIKGYRFFDEPYSMNIYGVRNKHNKPNVFNDILGVVYNNGHTTINAQFPATLDPGTHWLINPMDRGGAAAIFPGQYPGVWQLGKFKGTDALLQIKPIKVYRDNNRDAYFDYLIESFTEGNYGIFLHQHFQNREVAETIDLSSAGCVVPQTIRDWDYFFKLIKMQVLVGRGNVYSFTLFEEK